MLYQQIYEYGDEIKKNKAGQKKVLMKKFNMCRHDILVKRSMRNFFPEFAFAQ